MNAERYLEIERTGSNLTQDELNEGWHFCPCWDYMLVGPGLKTQEGVIFPMPEKDYCICEEIK